MPSYFLISLATERPVRCFHVLPSAMAPLICVEEIAPFSLNLLTLTFFPIRLMIVALSVYRTSKGLQFAKRFFIAEENDVPSRTAITLTFFGLSFSSFRYSSIMAFLSLPPNGFLLVSLNSALPTTIINRPTSLRIFFISCIWPLCGGLNLPQYMPTIRLFCICKFSTLLLFPMDWLFKECKGICDPAVVFQEPGGSCEESHQP